MINEKRLENDLQNTNWTDALNLHSDEVHKLLETFFSTICLSLMDMQHEIRYL